MEFVMLGGANTRFWQRRCLLITGYRAGQTQAARREYTLTGIDYGRRVANQQRC